jgi:hypothetical protein
VSPFIDRRTQKLMPSVLAMTAPTETSVVAPTAENESANILFDIGDVSLKLNTIGISAGIQD